MKEIKSETWLPDCYHDIPMAYAVFQAEFAADGCTVKDVRYVFVNQKYCDMVGKSRETLIGQSFSGLYGKDAVKWMSYCTQVLQTGKEIHDNVYSSDIKHWLYFTAMPLQQPGYVAYTFTNTDTDYAQKMHVRRHGLMNDIGLRISKILSNEENYEISMNHALQELGSVIHPDRLYVLETDCKTVSNTFEWCAEGVEPEIDTLQERDYKEYIGGWEKFLAHSSCVLIEDIEVLKDDDPIDYYNLKRQGIQRLIDVPFYHDGQLIGYLGADNYEKNDLINTRGILEIISYFIGSKIVNHRLMEQMKRLSRYDGLTGLHNRNAMQEKVAQMKSCSGSAGIVYADLNGLKEINDKFGHQAGNEALKKVADILVRCYGIENSYRMGGDEFIVLLPMVAECDFRNGLKQLRKVINEQHDISLAVGSEWIPDTAAINEAIRLTDRRMYSDKAEYYNRMNTDRSCRDDMLDFNLYI